MGYTKEVYRLAQRELDRRREQAERAAEDHREEMERVIPRLAEIRRDLSVTGLEAAKAAISGRADVEQRLDMLRTKNFDLQKERAEILTAKRLPFDFLEVHYTCPKCQDTGYRVAERCDCLTQLLRRIAYEAVSDAGGLSECRFDNFLLSYYPNTPDAEGNIPARVMLKVVQSCRQYAQTFDLNSESLLFRGHTGLGKTHLSLAIAHEVIERGYGVCYISTQRLLDKLQDQQFRREQTDGNDYQKMMQECDLLILDDLGAEFSTTFTVAALQNLINNRLADHRPTIISTNLDTKLMRERYGERVVSRLLCAYRVSNFLGDDIRFRKRMNQ